MTDVDFYILDSDKPQAKAFMACRLAEKIYKLGRKVYIHTDSAEACHELDRLLWTFRDGSFVPHSTVEQISDNEPVDPIIISHGDTAQHHTDVLINMTDEVPLFFSRFERVSEIISHNEKAIGRERFKFYRDRGYPLKSHNISG